MNRTATCLLLLCASAMAGAHEVRMHGPNGDGGCNETKATPSVMQTPAAKPAGSSLSHAKTKAPTTFHAGGDDDNSPHMPRWHSFLPGMFR
jgi:hypothetical protein